MAWAPDYATHDELASYLADTDTTPADPPSGWYDQALTAASRLIDRSCQRQFGKTTATDFTYTTPFWVPPEAAWYLVIDDVQDTTGMTVTVDDTVTTDYDLLDLNWSAKGVPATMIKFGSTVTVLPGSEIVVHAIFGWTSTPTPVKYATLRQAKQIIQGREGADVALLPDVAAMLTPYRRYF